MLFGVPGAGFVVGGAVSQAAVEDADQPVRNGCEAPATRSEDLLGLRPRVHQRSRLTHPAKGRKTRRRWRGDSRDWGAQVRERGRPGRTVDGYDASGAAWASPDRLKTCTACPLGSIQTLDCPAPKQLRNIRGFPCLRGLLCHQFTALPSALCAVRVRS